MTTQPNPGQCKYEYRWPQGGHCVQELLGWDLNGYCILHTQNLAKDKDEFRRAADGKIAKEDYNFQGCVVPDGVVASFAENKFSGEQHVDFSNSRWHGNARADFRGAQFYGNARAYFREAQFHDRARADFGGAQFHNQAWADFGGAQFHEKTLANFAGAGLQHLDLPLGEGFKGAAYFTGASFGQRTVFEGCKFVEGTTFEKVDLENLIFRGCNLAGVSFRDVQHLAEAEFDNITWGKQSELKKGSPIEGWRRQATRWWESLVDEVDRTMIWDERQALENKNGNYAATERVYQGLKQSYERRGDYPRGGEFYYGEMEMRRLAQGAWKRRLLSVPALYWHLSGYGLKWRKAGFWFILFWLLFALFHGVLGFLVAQPIPESTRVLFVAPGAEAVFSPEAVGHALWLSLGAMLLRPADIYTTTSGIGPLLVLAQGVLGPLLLGLMALAIRRKVHR